MFVKDIYYTCSSSEIEKEVYTDTNITAGNFSSVSLKCFSDWHFYYLGKFIRVWVMGWPLDNPNSESVLEVPIDDS